MALGVPPVSSQDTVKPPPSASAVLWRQACGLTEPTRVLTVSSVHKCQRLENSLPSLSQLKIWCQAVGVFLFFPHVISVCACALTFRISQIKFSSTCSNTMTFTWRHSGGISGQNMLLLSLGCNFLLPCVSLSKNRKSFPACISLRVGQQEIQWAQGLLLLLDTGSKLHT